MSVRCGGVRFGVWERVGGGPGRSGDVECCVAVLGLERHIGAALDQEFGTLLVALVRYAVRKSEKRTDE